MAVSSPLSLTYRRPSFVFLSLFCVLLSFIKETVAQAENVQSYGSWASIGCWTDSTSQRALRHVVNNLSNVTVEVCLDACDAAGFILGGLEYSHECYCGNAVLYDVGNPSSSCTMACSGNANELCGGPLALDLYLKGGAPYTVASNTANLASYGNWNYFACVPDSESNRVFPHEVPLSADTMTVEKCLDGCASAGYSVAGLQFGQECWCGNNLLGTLPTSSQSNCNLPCNDNAEEFCGGSLYNSVYSTASAPPVLVLDYGFWSWVDCTTPLSSFTTTLSIPPDEMTLQKCLDSCYDVSYTVGGLTNGNTCKCGTFSTDDLPDLSTNNCLTPCTGNTSEACGGEGYDAVYSFNPDYTPPQEIDGFHLLGCLYNEFRDWDPNWTGLVVTPQTLINCVTACAQGGWVLGGPSVGDECWCGNAFIDPFEPGTCHTLCPGDNTQVCGDNSGYILLYQKDGTTLVT